MAFFSLSLNISMIHNQIDRNVYLIENKVEYKFTVCRMRCRKRAVYVCVKAIEMLSHAHNSDDFKIACASHIHSHTHFYFIWQFRFIYCCCSFQVCESVFGRVFYGDGDNDNSVVCLLNALERASERVNRTKRSVIVE